MLAFVFVLTLAAFGGTSVTIETKSLVACKTVRALVSKQLMLAGVESTMTECAPKP